MARNWHYLRSGRVTGWPSQSVALSIVCSAGRVASETQPTRTARLLGWAAISWQGTEGRQTEGRNGEGLTVDSFWHWLHSIMNRSGATWLWTVGASYAMTQLGLWEALTVKHWALCGNDSRGTGGLCVVSDPPTIVMCRPSAAKGSTVWLDVRNLSPRMQWADLCGEGEWDTGRERARARAKALAQWLEGWYDVVRELCLGGLRMTGPSQAWAGWLASYMTCPVEVHTDERRLSAERESIYGGRNEVFRVGLPLASVIEIDATAHYPAIASSHPLPARIVRSGNGSSVGLGGVPGEGLLAIGRGVVATQVPVVPYRKGGVTVYPVGTWRATYCYPEIELIRRTGGTFNVEEWWQYEPADPWSVYMRSLWAARKRMHLSGRAAHEQAIKLLMNSLIGRACARSLYWEDRPDLSHHLPWDDWYHCEPGESQPVRRRAIAWRVQQECENGFGPEAVPALASYVYSIGRVRLWDWLETAGRDNVFYVDTDSLWTNGEGYVRLKAAGQMDNGELGRLRQIATHAWARFHGHKCYENPTGVTCAGIPPRELCQSDGGWERWVSESPGQAARAKKVPTAELIRYSVIARQPYRGGRVGAGGQVFPLEVND